jgi:hypothetical protein
MVDPNPGQSVKGMSLGVGIPGADYSVHAWRYARAAFGVVDKWRAALEQVTNDPMLLDKVLLDGEELRVHYTKCNEVAAVLVAEELSCISTRKHDGLL